MEHLEAFLKAATWHGTLEDAEHILAQHPAIARSGLHASAVLGDDDAVRRHLARDATSVSARIPPYDADPLNYLCLSRYLRLDSSRSDAFVRAATALLDSGADPNTGFWVKGERETALYGAAGVAHHAGLTKLLLARGADPNDEEAVYHSPETRDNDAMKVLVESGRITPDNLSLMLIRKHDWHDLEGARYLLEHGADPNGTRRHGLRPLHHALARDNALEMFMLLMDHGADPTVVSGGHTAVALAAREGRGDVLELFERRGATTTLRGVDRLIAACARANGDLARSIARDEPRLVEELNAMGGTLLAKFAGTCNPPGVGLLLDLGVRVDATFVEGDGYWGTPPGSLAIHVAAWRACTPVVRLLLERGSPFDLPDAHGRTPLALAVRACVDSYWTEYRSPDSARALLDAGASVAGAGYPSGYRELDELLHARGA